MAPLEPLRNLLPRSVRRARIEPEILAVQAFEAYQGLVRAALGPRAAGAVEPATLRSGTLHVRVRSNALLTELRLYESAWLEKLSRGHPPVRLQRVRYELV